MVVVVPLKLLRAITYARVSTTKTSQTASISRQVAELKEVAARRGWNVLYQFSDRISGGSARPGLAAALDHIYRGRADVLVVHDLDRLGRDTRSMLANVDAIHAAGGNFYILDRNIDTQSPEGRLTFTLFAALAEFQRRALGERIRAGLAHARKKGVRLGAIPVMTPAALARAVELRASQHPPLSWAEIVVKIKSAKLGNYHRGTLAGAVTREIARAGRLDTINRELGALDADVGVQPPQHEAPAVRERRVRQILKTIKTHRCDECDMVFASPAILRAHRFAEH